MDYDAATEAYSRVWKLHPNHDEAIDLLATAGVAKTRAQRLAELEPTFAPVVMAEENLAQPSPNPVISPSEPSRVKFEPGTLKLSEYFENMLREPVSGNEEYPEVDEVVSVAKEETVEDLKVDRYSPTSVASKEDVEVVDRKVVLVPPPPVLPASLNEPLEKVHRSGSVKSQNSEPGTLRGKVVGFGGDIWKSGDVLDKKRQPDSLLEKRGRSHQRSYYSENGYRRDNRDLVSLSTDHRCEARTSP